MPKDTHTHIIARARLSPTTDPSSIHYLLLDTSFALLVPTLYKTKHGRNYYKQTLQHLILYTKKNVLLQKTLFSFVVPLVPRLGGSGNRWQQPWGWTCRGFVCFVITTIRHNNKDDK
jgi:hypothetical protein